MRTCSLYLCFALLPTTGGCSQPDGMYQQAQVRLVDSQLCFAIADTGEARDTPPTLTSISVARFTGSDWEYVWRWTSPLEPPVQLSPDRCIPYGSSPIAGATGARIAALRPGERYGVSINAQILNPTSGGDPTVGRVYSQHFCLQQSGNGVLTPIQVSQVRGDPGWEVCGSSVAD